MVANKIKVGFLGVTHPHAAAHLRTLELVEEVSSVIPWDEDESAVGELANGAYSKLEFNHASFEQIMERNDIPVVVSLATNERNPDWVIRSANAGKHILTEKPVASTSRDMIPILESVRRAGVHLGVYYTWRSNPIVNEIREMIGNGVIGKLLSVEARMVTSQVRFRNPSHWLFQKNISGGGILSWLGCHWIDAVRYITQNEVLAVTSMVDTLNEQAIDVEDTAGVIMRLESGAIATLHAGYLLPISQSGYMSGSYDTYLSFRGLEGNITWYPTEEEKPVVVESTSKTWSLTPRRELKYVVAETEAYGGQYGQDFVGQFIASAIQGEPPADDGENAHRVLQIIEAAYQSSETGRVVLLD